MTITAREIHLAIKKGTTTKELAEKYGITAVELLACIRERMNYGANELIRNLQKNDKKRRKKEYSEPEMQEYESVAEDIPVTTDGEEEQVSNNNETIMVSSGSNLKMLKESEAELSEELIALEKKHEEMALRRRQILEKAKATSQIVFDIQEKLLELQREIEELDIEYDTLAEEMTANTEERRSYEELLEEVRGEIEVFSQVTAILKNDGTIECSNSEFIEMIDQETEKDELAKMMENPEAEEFTLRQLKGIVKAKLLGQIGVNVTFELQQAYNLI